MRRRNMYYETGMPGWMRMGYSPGWAGMPPCAPYILGDYPDRCWDESYCQPAAPPTAEPAYGPVWGSARCWPDPGARMQMLAQQLAALADQLAFITDEVAALEEELATGDTEQQ